MTDSGALDRMGEVFTDDVAYDLTGLDPAYGVLRGLDALRAAAEALGAGNPVGHHVTNTVLTALADGRVAARSKGIGVMADGAAGSVSYEDTVVRGPARLADQPPRGPRATAPRWAAVEQPGGAEPHDVAGKPRRATPARRPARPGRRRRPRAPAR